MNVGTALSPVRTEHRALRRPRPAETHQHPAPKCGPSPVVVGGERTADSRTLWRCVGLGSAVIEPVTALAACPQWTPVDCATAILMMAICPLTTALRNVLCARWRWDASTTCSPVLTPAPTALPWHTASWAHADSTTWTLTTIGGTSSTSWPTVGSTAAWMNCCPTSGPKHTPNMSIHTKTPCHSPL